LGKVGNDRYATSYISHNKRSHTNVEGSSTSATVYLRLK